MKRKIENKNYIPGLEKVCKNTFSKQSSGRPQYALENHEDEMYHEFRPPPELESEPEYCAFFDKVWVFNRKMEWIRTRENNILCYSNCGDLLLTGENQVSKWFSDTVNGISQNGSFTNFIKRSKERYRDCIVLPAFQFNLDQHPQIELNVVDSDSDWQFCVFVKGRSGVPLTSTAWKHGAAQIKVNIRDILHKKGYNLHFAELHFVLGVWSPVKDSKLSLNFSLKLCSAPAIILCLPVVRSIENVADDGIPVSAMLFDASGTRIDSSSCALEAEHQNNSFPLRETNGLWTGRIPALAPGEYNIKIVSTGIIRTNAVLKVRITDGKFSSFNALSKSFECEGKTLGPLSGSYQGITLFKNVGLSDERIVQGQAQWDEWDKNIFPGEHWHYWEAMTEKELDQRFVYLKKCGWNLLHLCQHFAHWERLDAGGCIAPHGAEQLELYLRIAARHELKVLFALTHYPYSKNERTKTYSKYIEAGFSNEDWTNVNSAFTKMFHSYLSDFVALFKEETSILAFSTSGEGDIRAGKNRINETFDFVTSLDCNHMFIAEPIHCLWQLPKSFCAGWKPKLIGSRTYWIGHELKPDFDLAIEYKLMNTTPNICMTEGCWPAQPLYCKFVGDNFETWCASEAYRTRVRDTLYLGLLHRSPLILTWEEQITEDERVIFNEIRKCVDWSKSFMKPPVMILIDESNVLDKGILLYKKRSGLSEHEKGNCRRNILFEYESFFETLVLETRYVTQVDASSKSYPLFDARKPFIEPCFESDGGFLPEYLKSIIPLEISEGYSANYLWSEDKKTFLAYIRNSGNYTERAIRLGGKFHRIPTIPFELTIKLKNFPKEKLQYRLYDLSQKRLFRKGRFVKGSAVLPLGKNTTDFFLMAYE